MNLKQKEWQNCHLLLETYARLVSSFIIDSLKFNGLLYDEMPILEFQAGVAIYFRIKIPYHAYLEENFRKKV